MEGRGQEDTPQVSAEIKDPELVQRRRAQIVDVAVEMFARKGFANTSVNEIAEACGMSVGTLYRYIKTKEDILFLVCEYIFGHLDEGLLKKETGREEDSRAALRSAIKTFMEAVDRVHRYLLLMYREYGHLIPEHRTYFMRRESAVATVLEKIVRAGVNQGVLECASPRLVALDIIILGHMLALKRWALKDEFDVDTFIELQTDLLLRALEKREPSGEEGLLAAGKVEAGW